MSKNEAFLSELYADLRQSLGKYPHVEVQREVRLEVPGQPEDLWPHADILIVDKKLHITFIVQDVDDADIVRRLAQCWPYLDARNQQDTALIQLWQHGTPAGGDRGLAQFLGEQRQDASYHFRYALLWRNGHPARTIAGRILVKLNAVVEDFADIRTIIAGRQEDDLEEREEKRDIEEVFAEIERSRGLSG